MKIINIMLSSIVALSMVMGAATIGFNKTIVDSEGSNVMAIESNEVVYGLQFEIKYNPNELVLNGINAKVTGYDFHCNDKDKADDGLAKCLLFSMQGVPVSKANDISELLEFDFSANNGFSGTSIVEFVDIVLAGENGVELEVNVNSFEVNTNALIPEKTDLQMNYPNPFNPTTTINFSIAEAGMTSLVIYDITGAVVKNLVSSSMESGRYNVVWNATNNQGNPVASGRYILKMTAPNYSETITMTLLK